MVKPEIAKQPNQSNPHTLGVYVNCVEALGSLFYIIRMRNFRESTESVLTPRMAQ